MDSEHCSIILKGGRNKGLMCNRLKCRLHRKKGAPPTSKAPAPYQPHREEAEEENDGEGEGEPLPRSQPNLEEFMKAEAPAPEEEETREYVVPPEDMLALKESNPEAHAELRKISQYRTCFPVKMRGIPEVSPSDSPLKITHVLNLMRAALGGDPVSVRAMKSGYVLGMRAVETVNSMLPFSPVRLSGLGDSVEGMMKSDPNMTQLLTEISVEWDLQSVMPSDPLTRLCLVTLSCIAGVHVINSRPAIKTSLTELSREYADV